MPHALHSVSLRRAAAAGTAARPLAPRVPVLHRNRFAPARSGSQEDVPASSDAQRVTDASSANAGEGPSTSYGGCLLDSLDSHVPYSFVAGLAAVGFAETVYLTASKLLGLQAVCPTSGCDSVLNSAYAQLFGLPLPLFGAAAYGGVAAVAAAAAALRGKRQEVPGALDSALFAGSTLLATCSATLMFILQTRLGGENCAWCYLSAGLSFSILTTLIIGMPARQLRAAAAPGAGALATAALTLYLGLGPADQSMAQDFELPYKAPEVTTQSSSNALTLAKRLKDAGAVMYGAFWCSHCFDQKQDFGVQAMADFPYVECFPEGWKKGVKIDDACSAAGVRAFPTWLINGRVLEGEFSLEELGAELDKPAEAAQL